jgi:hypothetical protein
MPAVTTRALSESCAAHCTCLRSLPTRGAERPAMPGPSPHAAEAWTIAQASVVSLCVPKPRAALQRGCLPESCCRFILRVSEALVANSILGTGQHAEDDHHWPTTIASIAAGTVFFALWFWLLPSWLGFHVDMTGAARWRWIAALLWCVSSPEKRR